MKFSSSALVFCMLPRSAAFTNGLKQASKKILNRIPIAMVSAEAATSSPVTTSNPLLDQDGLPKFASIEPSNLTPAVTSLLEKMEKDFESFEEQISKEEFEKKYETILPEIERMQFPLGYVWGVAGHLNGVKNSDELRKAYEENQPKIVTSFSKFSQSKPLYDAMSALEEAWENDASSADDDFYLAQQKRAVKNSLRSMKLGGVGLTGSDKERFNAIKLRLAELSTSFSNNVLDATKAFHLDITDPADVAGVPSSSRAMWASNYKAGMKKEHDKDVEATADAGPYRIGLDAPSYIAAMQHIPNRQVREKIYKAFLTRASEFTKTDDEKSKDNVPLIYEILKLKMERAKLLGFKTPAEMSLASKMAPSVESVLELSEMILEKALPAAMRELDEITALARANGGEEYSEEKLEKLMPWDTTYWSERLKESKFDMKEEELRPYFALPNVLNGMFGLVERIFNIEVRSADGEAEVWNPDVQFFNVFDKENGKHIASFYLDPYSRPADKRGGAWMDTCIGKSEAVKRDVPVAYLTCNGSPPVDGVPSLMTFREVETLFHEFGHGLQHMLTRATVGDVAGISGVEWDAVELPSQFMENWCYDKKTVYGFAKHYETGEPLPEEMFAKLNEQKTFGAGMMACRQLLFGMLDMELHANFDAAKAENGGESIFDVHRRLAEKCTPYALPLKEDRFLCSFNHIFAGGYSAGYYSYKWAEVMSADAFGAFEEVGLENEEKVQETGRRFRDTVLSLGGGIEPMEVFMRFRGREPSPEALLRHNGLA
jgi:oligopeptidase A